MFEIWESPEAFDALVTLLGPVMEALGIQLAQLRTIMPSIGLVQQCSRSR